MTRLLLIDDDKLICSTLRKRLLMAGFIVDDATEGEKAMKMLELKGYHVVITDILMANKGGFEIIRDVKKKYPATKIIAMSGGGVINKENILASASKMGADHCIEKPFDFDALVTSIHELAAQCLGSDGKPLSASGLFDLI